MPRCLRKSRNPRLRRSATIIEIVAAIVILGVAMPTLMSAFGDAAVQSIGPYQRGIASLLAIERMEEIVARRYRGTDGYSAITTANFPSESPVSGFATFDRSVTVTFTNAALATVGSDQGYKLVRVNVQGGGEEIEIERLFADF